MLFVPGSLRRRPQGNSVQRLNRSHRLLRDVRAVCVFGGPYGMGRELVTGARFNVAGGTPTISTVDGPAFYAPTSGDWLETDLSLDAWAIPGEATCVARVKPIDYSYGIIAHKDNYTSDMGYALVIGDATQSIASSRAGPTGWDFYGSGQTFTVDTSRVQTHGVAFGSQVWDVPDFYTDGILHTGTPGNLWQGGSNGPANSSAGALRVGRRAAGGDKAGAGHTSLIVVSARKWTQRDFAAFQSEAWNIFEDTPTRVFFAATPQVSAPSVAARAGAVSPASNSGTHSITLPTHTIGQMLVVVFSTDGNPTVSVDTGSSSSGWTKLGQTSDSNSQVTGAIFWKIAASSSETLTISTNVIEQSSHVSFAINNATTIEGTSSQNGGSTNSDPPSLSPVGLIQNYLWIATRSGDAVTVATAAPSGYSNLQTQTGTVQGAGTNTAEKSTTGLTTEDPGVFTSATEQWVSWTLAVWTPSSNTTHYLGSVGIAAGTPTVGTPTIGQTHVLTATGISTAPTVGTPTLNQTHILTATGIAAGTPTVGTPTLGQAHVLTATGVAAGTPTVGSPTIGQVHVLSATGIAAGTPTVGTPTLTHVLGSHDLTAVGISTSPTVGSPTLGQVHVFAAAGISTAPVVGTPTLNQVFALTAVGISTTPVVGVPTLGQTHVLAAVGIAAGTPTIGVPTLNEATLNINVSLIGEDGTLIASALLTSGINLTQHPGRERIYVLPPEPRILDAYGSTKSDRFTTLISDVHLRIVRL